MRIADLAGKRVCILGFGKEGKATLRALEKYAPNAQVSVADDQGIDMGQGTRNREQGTVTYVGTIAKAVETSKSFDVLIKSPGIPPSSLFTVHCALSTSTQLFLEEAAARGSTVIGVTGSKGKSTTSTLIEHILKASDPKSHIYLVGNIGKPVLDFLEHIKPNTIFVQEMSSFQLMDCTRSPHIAVVTSFFPEHLDYHGSLEAYCDAKANISRFQGPDDAVVFAAESPGSVEIAKEGHGRKIPCLHDDAPIALEETRLIGRHNLSNIALAWRVAEELGVRRETAVRAIRSFEPLPHRLQSLGVIHGIEWIDDAISTTPESTIAALDALGDRVTTVILGGTDRGLDFSQLAERIARSSVRTVILFPGSGPRIKNALEAAKVNVTFSNAATMEEAVAIARKTTNYELRTTNSPIVLLSTASPSYNMFKNFEEKGDCFRKAVESS